MNRMVMDLLDIDGATSRGLVASLERVNVQQLLQQVRETRARRAGAVSITCVIAPEAPRVRADPELLRRVIDNLVDNALKYGAGKPIVVGTRVHAGEVEIFVADHGPGIPEEERDLVFERYARLPRHAGVHAATSRGLGLHFCRLAVEAQGGRIAVNGNRPTGSVLSVRLPSG